MIDENNPRPTDGIAAGEPPLPASPMLPPATSRAAVRSVSHVGPGPGDMKDGTREIIETIVFVVVLVLLLKTFLAEAFVIPTGSMATTLLGYHRDVTCDMCGYSYLVNASSETEESSKSRRREDVTKCYCPNCRYLNVIRRPQIEGVQP